MEATGMNDYCFTTVMVGEKSMAIHYSKVQMAEDIKKQLGIDYHFEEDEKSGMAKVVFDHNK